MPTSHLVYLGADRAVLTPILADCDSLTVSVADDLETALSLLSDPPADVFVVVPPFEDGAEDANGDGGDAGGESEVAAALSAAADVAPDAALVVLTDSPSEDVEAAADATATSPAALAAAVRRRIVGTTSSGTEGIGADTPDGDDADVSVEAAAAASEEEAEARSIDSRQATGADRSRAAVSPFERSPEGIVLAEDGRIREANRSAADLLGSDPEALAGTALADAIGEEAAAALEAALPDDADRRTVGATVDGREIRVTVTSLPDGPELLFLQPVEDLAITHRGVVEERVFLEGLLDNLADIFFVMDLDFNYVRWNDRLVEVTGYDDDEIAERTPVDLIADEDASEAMKAIERALDDGHGKEELRIETRDGERIPYEFTGALVCDSAGEPAYICGIGRDITERKRQEQRLREKQRELDRKNAALERSNAELERFAYVASHDLKEPLRMITSYLELLERRYGDELDEEATEFLEYAKDGGKRLRGMIEDLLRYSRVGRKHKGSGPVDCEEAIDTVRSNLDLLIDQSDAELRVESMPTVRGVESLVVQLFQNLISNAVAHGGDGVSVEVRATRRDDFWEFAVADDGPGIDESRLDDIFEIFSHDPESSGTGIGLATAKKIVDYHGGDIRVESEVGEGTTFYFTLPAVDADQEVGDPTDGGTTEAV